MTVLTEKTKVVKVNEAFSKLITSYLKEEDYKTAQIILDAVKPLPESSKAKLFDILTEANK